MKDSWCRKLVTDDGQVLTGGAARNKRIALGGGLDVILTSSIAAGVQHALSMVERGSEPDRPAPPRRIVRPSRTRSLFLQ